MSVFRRREHIEENEEETVERERKEIEKFSKKFKDLKPANRKKRKEPPKPWGRKERYIVLAVLAATIIVAVFLTMSSQNSINIKFHKPSLRFDFFRPNLFEEKVIIIQKR